MTDYTVHFASGAGQAVDVTYDGTFDAIAIAEAASEDLDTNLCHHCSKVELGDFEAVAISDEDGEEIWSEPDRAEQRAISELEAVVGLRGGLPYDEWATQIADRAVARLNKLRGGQS